MTIIYIWKLDRSLHYNTTSADMHTCTRSVMYGDDVIRARHQALHTHNENSCASVITLLDDLKEACLSAVATGTAQ